MLNNLGWIEVNSKVNISEEGKEVYAKLLDLSEERSSNTGYDDNDEVWSGNLGEKSIEQSCSSNLPLTQMKPSSVTEENQVGLQTRPKKVNDNKNTIMIVDDEEDIAQTYEYFLSSIEYEVRTFIDPRLALHEYLSDPFRYDLLIVDIRMQGLNGLQLYQSIKAINPECKAIFVSALDAAREVVSILPGMKPQQIIRKPVSKEQLLSAVKTALVQQ